VALLLSVGEMFGACRGLVVGTIVEDPAGTVVEMAGLVVVVAPAPAAGGRVGGWVVVGVVGAAWATSTSPCMVW